MKARHITILASAVITLVMTVTMLFVAHRVVLDQFAVIEHEHVVGALERTIRLFNAELQGLNRTAEDYATWDDTYLYMKDRQPEYLRSNYADNTLQNLRLRMVMLCDVEGNVAFRRSTSPQGARDESDADLARLQEGVRLLRQSSSASSIAGLMGLSEGPVMVAIRPILTTAASGPKRGSLIMVRDLDYRVLAQLSSLIGLPLELGESQAGSAPLRNFQQETIQSSGRDRVEVNSYGQLTASTELYDVRGHSLLTLRLIHPREVWQGGQHAFQLLMYSIVILGLVFGGLNLIMVQKLVVARVEKLTRFAQKIGTEQGLGERVDIGGNDELTQLGKQINLMLEELNVSHEKLVVARERLHYEATHDPLTGAWNRAAALELLDRELARGEREGTSVAVLMLDVDHFKNVNDGYGHAAGDRVLQSITASILSILRNFDVLARYGGEEFLVIAPNCNLHEGRRLAERILFRLQTTPTHIGDAQVAVTASVGVAAGSFPYSSEQLIALADKAMYQAKEDGRNRVHGEDILPSPSKGNLYAMPRRKV